MAVEQDSDGAASSPKATSSQSLHAHRLNHTPSKLPAFRFGDLKRPHLGISNPSLLSPDLPTQPDSVTSHAVSQQGTPNDKREQRLNITTSAPVEPSSLAEVRSSSPERVANPTPNPPLAFHFTPSKSQSTLGGSVSPRVQDNRSRRAPASHSSNGIATFTGPPPALSTQRTSTAEPVRTPISPTTEWALAQQELAFQSFEVVNTPIDPVKSTTQPRNQRALSRSLDDSISSKSRIPPIRAFRSSATRATLEMANRGPLHFDGTADDQENDRDRTLRALEGIQDEQSHLRIQTGGQDERRHANEASTEDLFLTLARDNSSQDNTYVETSTGTRRRSRIALANNRQSLPPTSSTFQMARVEMPRRGSDLQGTSPPGEVLSDRITYRRDRPVGTSPNVLNDLNKSRYTPSASQSTPSTPRASTGRDSNFQSALSYGGRKPSIPDTTGHTPQRLPGYRQSNLSYGTSRVYNSSPLVSRSMEAEDGPETPRAAEGTESTTSTTAPSTVWDELDDLKSRIRKLELTGKLPATSGAAVSHATGDRPPTATTTITTMSTSPKRGRGLSASPIDSNTGPSTSETHPLLHSALAKSKPLLSSEIYAALEATASDALTIAAMMGPAGQPGPISSSQSTIGGNSVGATERQLRRKADSMCRSLTELCLALSEDQPLPQPQAQSLALVLPVGRDRDLPESPRVASGLARVKSSPRALSRQEARRSTLLGNSSLPAPRYVSGSASNSNGDGDGSASASQTAFSGRRTSLLVRNRRAATEEPDEDELRFRAPSRAFTEIGRTRNLPREYTSRDEPPPLPGRDGAGDGGSRVPVRRHFASTSLGNGNVNSSPTIGGLRYLDRATPERNFGANSVAGKLAGDRSQRVFEPRSSGLGTSALGLGRTGSLGRQRLQRDRAEDGQQSMVGSAGGYQ